MFPWDQHPSFGHSIHGKIQIRELLTKIRVKQDGGTEVTYKMLELVNHPYKPLRAHTNIILVKTRSPVDNVRLALSNLDDIDVRKSPGLDSSTTLNENLETGREG